MTLQSLLGKKIGMTQVFKEDGRVQPVTVIKTGTCLVTQVKTETKDGYHFTIEMKSRRANFDMVMLVGFISVGQAMNHQEAFAKRRPGYQAVLPKNTLVTVIFPTGRNNSTISASATEKQVRKLANGEIDTAEFMILIKDSISTS